MPKFQPFFGDLWWLPYATLLLAAGSITVGLVYGYRALWLWHRRDTPILDPVIAKLLEDVKPPPYAIYAALWLALGIILAVWTCMQ